MAELDDERLVLASSRLPLMRDSGYSVWRGEGANMCECVSEKKNVKRYFLCGDFLTCSVLLLEVEPNESGG